MKSFLRNILYHFFGFFLRRRYFRAADLRQIEDAIRQSEKRHGGEIAVVIETARPLTDVIRRISVRQRAENFFTIQRIWDTEENCGVLIYLLLSEHRLEIIADRGIASRVSPQVWQQMLKEIQPMLQQHRGVSAVLYLIEQIDMLLRQYFPRKAHDQNELKDQPTVI